MEELVADFTIDDNEPFEYQFNLGVYPVFWGYLEGNIEDQTDLINILNGCVKEKNGNITISNSGTSGGILYNDTTTGENYGIVIDNNSIYGAGVVIGAGNNVTQNGYVLYLSQNGLSIFDAHTRGIALLTVTDSNNLAVNGNEIATKNDINALVARIEALEANNGDNS